MLKRPVAASIADTLKRWKKEGNEIELGLRERRAQCVAEIEIIDRALQTFEERRAPPPAAPARAVRTAGTNVGPRSAGLAELRDLMGYVDQAPKRTQTMVRQRADGKSLKEIANAVGGTNAAAVGAAISYAVTKMRIARGRDSRAATPAADREGGDEDEDPEPAVHFAIPALVYAPPKPSIEEAKQQVPEVLRPRAPVEAGAGADPPGVVPKEVADLPAAPVLEPATAELVEELEAGTMATKVRRRIDPATSTIRGRVRSKTIAPRRLTRDEQRLSELAIYPEDVDRPMSRSACHGAQRPCPFVSCSHHLYLDVNPETGAIKMNFPHLEVWEMAQTCSLDVADKGGITLEEVGAILNLTRERIRQVEVRGLDKIREHSTNQLGLPPERAGGRYDSVG